MPQARERPERLVGRQVGVLSAEQVPERPVATRDGFVAMRVANGEERNDEAVVSVEGRLDLCKVLGHAVDPLGDAPAG